MPSPTRAVIQDIVLPPFDPLNRRAAELRAQGHRVISLGQAVPYFPPPEAAIQAARTALDAPDVHRYATDPGLPTLRTALAERLAAMAGTRIVNDDVIITAGANHAFTLALATLVDPGDEVILPGPYFTNHQMAVRRQGAIAVEAPVADRESFSVRWSDIQPYLSLWTKAIVLCNPSNPTGAPIDPAEGAHWSAASLRAWRENVVVIGTFSKSFGMMGWRVGFLLADAAICEQAIKVQDEMIICAPAISQIMAEAAVRESWNYPASFHDELRTRRRILADGLSKIPCARWTPTSGGMFTFVQIDGCTDSTQLSNELLDVAHLVTIPGAAFGQSGEGFLRLSYGYAGAAELVEATERLRQFFAR